MATKKRRKKVDKSNIPQTGFFFDSPSHSYWLDGKPLQGVTSILGVIAKPALVGWASRMACEYMREHQSEFGAPEWFDGAAFEAALKEAQVAHTKRKETAATSGTELHAMVEDYINDCIMRNDGKPFPILQPENANIDAFSQWAMRERIVFIASEKRMYHADLRIAGTCDIIFDKDGQRVIGDVKNFKKIWDNVPGIQCAAYSLMYNELPETIDRVSASCVICLPKDRPFNPDEDVKWSYDLESDQTAFMAALTLYRHLKNWSV